ncbi:MAG TPA: phosphoribosylanthranilate isomerase [Candidatus Nitrosotalea sp.]|jgi:phosphoribosylanthranilate isomerase|nr:phosphoribosylanthranilate isomerase [Candidatus Nitrosotalea sp.]
MKIKICGITNADDARLCVEAGADALGFIFVEGTPRYVTPDAAARIVATLPPFVTPVGVFWDHAPGHVKAVAEQCRLGALQFHGDESPEDLQEYRLPVIKTLKVAGVEDLARMAGYRVAAFLLDSPSRWSEGETRPPIPWDVAAEAARRYPVLLSAGLTPENVAGAVRRVRPYGVDVNSGVEAHPGRKDETRVRRFVAAARAAEATV